MTPFFKSIEEQQKLKKTFLCVGLDPHLDKLPSGFKGKKEAVLPFLKDIVDATVDLSCCYKPQIAYFAAYGLESSLFEIIDYIHKKYPNVPVILDAKRNDIGTTAEMYAMESFDRYQADAVTVSPYMGGDTIEPFSRHKEKGVFVLCRTSNEGAKEFQNLSTGDDGSPLYSFVAERAINHWNEHENIGLVLGATAVGELRKVRERFSSAWFLVPGVGAQGGDLESVIQYGTRAEGGGLIINSARGILYASSGDDYALKAKEQAQALQKVMAKSF